MTPTDTISPSLRRLRSYVLWSGIILYFFAPLWTLLVLEATLPHLLQHTSVLIYLASFVGLSFGAALSGKRLLDYGLDGEPALPTWLLPTLGALTALSTITGALIDTSAEEAAPLAATPAVLPMVVMGLVLHPIVSARASYLIAAIPPLIGGAHQALQSHLLAQETPSIILTRVIATVIGMSVLSYGVTASYQWSMSVLRAVDSQSKFDTMKAELSAAEERLRIARDLHDVFGRTLTAVAVKSELAAALAEAEGAAKAAAESRRIKNLAQDALKEVRTVLAEYRRPDLATEIAGAHSLLTASGMTVRIVGRACDMMDDLTPTDAQRTSEALALVVREAGTNIVRHSDACNVSISLSQSSTLTTLTITNDGVTGEGGGEEGDADTTGSGLDSLSARLAPLGAHIEWRKDGQTFTVTAHVTHGSPPHTGADPKPQEIA